MLLFAMMGIIVSAGTITFGDLSLENGVQYADPFDGGDFTVTFAGGSNDGKYYTTGSGIRVYGGGTMTIAAKSGTLTKIVITFHSTYKPTEADVVSTGTYDTSTGTWTGDASEVVFTRPSGSGHWRVQKIETGSDATGPDVPTEGQTPEAAITVTRALELINAMSDGETSSATYYVKGVVTSLGIINSSGASFNFGETATAENTVQAYKLKGLENKEITNTEFLNSGDAVVVFGSLQKYKNASSGTVTPEVSGGYVYSINGNTKDETPNPEDAITKGKTADDAMTAAEALVYINDFTDGFSTTNQYYVQGEVGEVEEISTENGNATFNFPNGLKAFRLKGIENTNITDANYIKEDDKVIVLAKLQKYVKEGTVTPELSSGYIYSLNGETTVPVTLEGEGTEEKPYTVGDLKQMGASYYTGENVWFEGYIIGSASSATALKASDANVVSNIAVAAEAPTTEAAASRVADVAPVFVPVELKASSVAREKLNVLDNPANIGKKVKLYGQIQRYFSTTGMKELAKFELDGAVYNAGVKKDITISPESGDIATALDEAIGSSIATSVTINLKEGAAYTVSKSIASTGNLTINGAEGATIDASALEAPFMTFSDLTVSKAKKSDESESDYFEVPSVTVKDVTISGLTQSFFNNAAGKVLFDKVTIDNVVLEVSGNNTIFAFANGFAGDLQITNSTIWSKEGHKGFFFQAQGRPKDIINGVTTTSWTIDKSTLYQIAVGKKANNNNSGIKEQSTTTMTLTNSILVDFGSNVGNEVNGWLWGQNGGSNAVYNKNTYWSAATEGAVVAGWTDAEKGGSDQTGTSLTTDPTFVNAAEGNFTIGASTDQAKEKTGDPRWLVEYVPTAIFNVKAADAVNAPIFNMAGQRVNDSFKGVVIQNGKKFVNK